MVLTDSLTNGLFISSTSNNVIREPNGESIATATNRSLIKAICLATSLESVIYLSLDILWLI